MEWEPLTLTSNIIFLRIEGPLGALEYSRVLFMPTPLKSQPYIGVWFKQWRLECINLSNFSCTTQTSYYYNLHAQQLLIWKKMTEGDCFRGSLGGNLLCFHFFIFECLALHTKNTLHGNGLLGVCCREEKPKMGWEKFVPFLFFRSCFGLKFRDPTGFEVAFFLFFIFLGFW